MKKRISITLATVSALLVSTTLLGSIPATIYSGNASEFSWPFLSALLLYWPYALGGILASALIASILPRGGAAAWSSVVAILAFFVWAHGTFQFVPLTLLDGQNWTTESSTGWLAIDIASSAVIILLFGLLVRKNTRGALVLLGILSIGAIAQTAMAVSTDKKPMPSTTLVDQSFYQFSTNKNVLVILLDAMQSDVFEDAMQLHRDVEAAFQGFEYFPDTAAVSTTTYLAIPTIHSGLLYEGKEPLQEVYNDWVVKRSFMSQLAHAGYQGTMINAVLDKCPSGLTICTTAASVLASPEAQRKSDAARLVDVTLLRIVPAAMRGAVYNDGKWTVGNFVQQSDTRHFSVEGNAVLRKLSLGLTNTASQPTVKFLHLFSTHLPVSIGTNCEFIGEQKELTRPAYTAQIGCALSSVADLFAAMKKAGVYDDTAIVVMADHGTTGLGSARQPSGKGEISTNLIGVANPTLAFKPIGSKGSFASSAKSMSLADVAGLICGNVGDCSAPKRGPTRLFNRYTWDVKYWSSDTVPDLTTFDISGIEWNPNSWAKRVE